MKIETANFIIHILYLVGLVLIVVQLRNVNRRLK